MPYSTNVIRLLEKVEPSTREVLIAVLEEIEYQRATYVTKDEFNELKEIVKSLTLSIKELTEAQRKSEERISKLEKVVAELAEAQKQSEQRLTRLEQTVAELAEAQKKTEQRLNELAEAQKQSEQRLTRLEQTVNELAEAQKRSEQRLTRLEQTVAELAEAQKKTEQRLNELAEAQQKTEQRLNELAEAQQKTEQELKKLIGEHRKTREQLGGLTHTVGYLLEDRAFVGLPPLLEKEKGIKLVSPLKRDYIEIGPGRYLEVNIIGKAKRNGKEIWIIGECKTQLKKKDVDKFLKFLREIKDLLGKDIFPVLVTYQAPPQVQRYVKEKGIDLYFSYQFPL
jgi:myosin heavy subunit